MEETNKEQNYISTSNFKIGDIAYVIRDKRYPSCAYPVRILDVRKSSVVTTAPPIDLSNVGVGYRDKFVFKEYKWKFYVEKERDKEWIEKYEDLLNSTCLCLEKQNAPMAVLLPTIDYIYILAKRSGCKKFWIENYVYNTKDKSVQEDGYYDTESDMRFCLTTHIGKTGIKRSDIAEKLGRSVQFLNHFLRGYIIFTEQTKKDIKELLIKFGYDIKEYKGEE